MKLIVHHGFGYQWDSRAFLNQAQTAYALEQLWQLVAGSADWDGPPAVTFRAIDLSEVERMLDAAPGAMAWMPLAAVSPAGWNAPLDTDRLPSLCCANPVSTAYDATTPFPLDLVAGAFLLLTRWEEWTRPAPDAFGCHKEDASIAVRQGFRDRPILDEWALVLRAWLIRARPGWSATVPAHCVEFSHDIDVLRYYHRPVQIARAFGRKLLKERLGVASFSAVSEGAAALLDSGRDPCVIAFDTLMDFSERRGTRSTFFFMASRPGKFDDGYAVDSKLFTSLRDRIRDRGHHLGWHPGYDAAQDDSVFAEELERFTRATGASHFGVRHHFLRWRAGYSWKRLAAHGIAFDASVGYNYCAGFRASTARPYAAFDLESDQPLQLEVRPLIAMDGPLQRDASPVGQNVALLKKRCAAVGGCLTMLVHNYSLMNNPTLLASIVEGLDAVEAG